MKAEITSPSFKNLPEKLPRLAAFSGLVFLSNFRTSSSEVGKKVNYWFFVVKKPKLNLN